MGSGQKGLARLLCLFSTDEPSKMENAKGIDGLGTRFGGGIQIQQRSRDGILLLWSPKYGDGTAWLHSEGFQRFVVMHIAGHGRRCENARIHMTTDGRRGVWLGRGRGMGAWARLRPNVMERPRKKT